MLFLVLATARLYRPRITQSRQTKILIYANLLLLIHHKNQHKMSANIEKIIVRLQDKYASPSSFLKKDYTNGGIRIAEGQFYEAQQQTRVVAARYIKSESWDAAIDILFNVSQSLLKAGQGGSGGDLGLFLIETYKQAELQPNATNKGKLLTLLRLFDSEEPTRKKFIGEMISYVTLNL